MPLLAGAVFRLAVRLAAADTVTRLQQEDRIMGFRRERLTLINRPHGPGLVLARRFPGDEALRSVAVEHWRPAGGSPRQPAPAEINVPVSPRENTAHQINLPREQQDALNGFVRTEVSSRRMLEHQPPALPVRAIATIASAAPERKQHGTSRIRSRLE